MSAESSAGRRRQPARMLLGYAALALFGAAVVLALLKLTPPGLACVVAGGLAAVAALVLEYRERQAVMRNGGQVFPKFGTFGARRSRQTHLPF